MLAVRTTKQFERDFKLAIKQSRDITEIKDVMSQLARREEIEPSLRRHPLSGQWRGTESCHLSAGLLLLWEADDEEITFVRLGTHSEIYGR
jgi:mRNA interferase YafQ